MFSRSLIAGRENGIQDSAIKLEEDYSTDQIPEGELYRPYKDKSQELLLRT